MQWIQVHWNIWLTSTADVADNSADNYLEEFQSVATINLSKFSAAPLDSYFVGRPICTSNFVQAKMSGVLIGPIYLKLASGPVNRRLFNI